MLNIKQLNEEIEKLLNETEQELEISDKVRYHESIEDELKELGINIDELEIQLLVSEYTIPKNFKEYFTKEINNNLSDEQKKKKVLIKYIGDWKVIFINNGFDNYIVIGKRPIVSAVEELWED